MVFNSQAPDGRLRAKQLLKKLQEGPDSILQYLPKTVGQLKKLIANIKKLKLDGKFIKYSVLL
jgi:hypothetical protein